MKFYEKLMRLRKRKGLSQEELADVLDISRQSVYKWESGTNMPDKDNLEKLTKFFNVSFNYLLDEDNEEIDQPKQEVASSAVKKFSFRRVFVSNHPLNQHKIVRFFDQPNIEHGYAPKQRIRIKNSKEIFSQRKKQTEDILKSRGYSTVIQIQENLLTYYFEDYNARTFGFFFDGTEQFVCPFENLIDASIKDSGKIVNNTGNGFLGVNVGGILLGGSGKTQNVKSPQIHYITILYFDEEGKNREYTLSFSKFAEYLFTDVKKTSDIEIQMEVISMNLGGIINNVCNKLKGLKGQAELIKNNQVEVTDLDIPAYIKRYEKEIAVTKKQNQEVIENGKALKKKKTIKKLIFSGIVAVAVAVIFIIAVI